jgi:4-amino-4-deoxy-L-arabinose transferase-like glycosyltransferase
MRFASLAASVALPARPPNHHTVSTIHRTPAFDAPETTLPVTSPAARPRRSLRARVHPRYGALACILALSTVLNVHRLAQNGYANTFYSAAVQSMLKSLHNFLYVSFDPGGLVTIDKPPLAVWVQVISAKLFGFSPLSLLLPEAIICTIAVAVLYRIVSRRLGVAAGLASALALAVFPSFVAVSRDNGVDPLLLLLMILACGAALNAIEDGRWRWILGCAVLVGLAFNTKTLAAYLVVPGIAFGYLACARGSLPQRSLKLLVAGVVMVVVSFSWIALVELTPPSQRPFIGSSTTNTELGLTFEYNGFGRVEGEVGGPGQIPVAEGAFVRGASPRHHPSRGAAGPLRHGNQPPGAVGNHVVHHAVPHPPAKHALSPYLPNGRLRDPIAFGEPTGPLRLFEAGLDGQGAWLLPFALIGMLALLLLAFVDERARRNPRLACTIVFGGWLLVEVVILSFSKGIVHPYYVSGMAPGAAVMVGGGTVALASFARRRHWGLVLLPCAVVLTVMAQLTILHEQHYMHWFEPILIAGVAVGMCAMALRRLSSVAMAFTLGVLLVAPTAYAATTWLAPVEGTFPAAGPHEATGEGLFGQSPAAMGEYHLLIRYVSTHRPTKRWALLVDASPTAAPFDLLGLPTGAVGGYSGTDPALTGPGLARLVAHREARYVVIGGAYATRGGNLATKAVIRDCRQVPSAAWHGPPASIHTLVLFDCAGRERALSAPVKRGAHTRLL